MARILECSIASCEGRHYAHGFCIKHYKRQKRHGDPSIVKARGFAASPYCREGHDKRATGEGSGGTCLECMRIKAQGKRAERRRLMQSIKMTKGCAECGYKGHPAALHFHHLNPSEKVKNVAHMGEYTSDEQLLAEIDKCIILCANCHAVRDLH